MTAVGQTRLATAASQGVQAVSTSFHYLSKPNVFSLVRTLALGLLLLWILSSVFVAISSFLPETAALPALDVVNPPTSQSEAISTVADIDSIVAADLFGAPGAIIEPEQPTGRSPAMSESEAAVALAGIENGAPETRLPLVLRGVVASTEAGLGQAIIENKKRQDLYQVGDELPLSGEVELAKVLPDRVVLDNGGRYEILRLFEDTELSDLGRQLANASTAQRAAVDRPTNSVPTRVEEAGEDAAELAATYRERLYQDPESLAEVVRIAPVRDGGDLQGYRLSPGRATAEFSALGFKSGDIVTAVNGLSLNNPSNTVRLYQDMRSATQADFELLRGEEVITLSVSIGNDGTQR